jgi:hypothetical protein
MSIWLDLSSSTFHHQPLNSSSSSFVIVTKNGSLAIEAVVAAGPLIAIDFQQRPFDFQEATSLASGLLAATSSLP